MGWIEKVTVSSKVVRVQCFEGIYGVKCVGHCVWGVNELEIPASYVGRTYLEIAARIWDLLNLDDDCYLDHDPKEVYYGGNISIRHEMGLFAKESRYGG